MNRIIKRPDVSLRNVELKTKLREDKFCLVCSTKIIPRRYASKISIPKKFCSRGCFHKSRIEAKGKLAPNYKDGRCNERLLIRASLEMRNWRKSVFHRDNYTCQECGDDKGGNLQADHIKPFALFPELRFEISNGRTLCKNCHKVTPTYGFSKMYVKAN